MCMFQSRPTVGEGGKLGHLQLTRYTFRPVVMRQVNLAIEIPALGTGLWPAHQFCFGW